MLDFLMSFILRAGRRGALRLTDHQTEAHGVTFPTAQMPH